MWEYLVSLVPVSALGGLIALVICKGLDAIFSEVHQWWRGW